MPRTNWGWQVTAAEFESWILHRDDELLVIDKPAHVVCHPSKHGPWSSLIGAAKQYLGQDTLHMPSRLDRETTGVVPIARSVAALRRLRNARKTYLAVLAGELREAVTVDQPIGKDPHSAIAVRRAVAAGGQRAETRFEPLVRGAGMTLARVYPLTGRMHQIRVHAAWLAHSVIGDKLYGPDERLFLDFIAEGWTPRLEAALGIDHHALHAAEWAAGDRCFRAPAPASWQPLLDRINRLRQSEQSRPSNPR